MSPQYGNFGPLAAEIDPVVWATQANFNGFGVLAAHSSTGRQLNFAALNRGCRLYSAGRSSLITLGIGPHSSFFMPYLCQLFFRHDVEKALRNVCYCDDTFLIRS